MKALWDYLDEVSKSGVKQKSVDLYRRDLGLFGLYLLKEKKKDFPEATKEDIEEYLLMRKKKRSASVHYGSFTRIRSFYEYLVKKGIVAENPAAAIKALEGSSVHHMRSRWMQ